MQHAGRHEPLYFTNTKFPSTHHTFIKTHYIRDDLFAILYQIITSVPKSLIFYFDFEISIVCYVTEIAKFCYVAEIPTFHCVLKSIYSVVADTLHLVILMKCPCFATLLNSLYCSMLLKSLYSLGY